MHRRRITVVFGAAVLGFLLVEIWLFSLQIVSGGYYADYADRQRVALVPLNVARARILSADGVVLAEDRQAFDIAVVIGRLDPGDERALRDPLRRLFWVPRRQRLHRIEAADFEVLRDVPPGTRERPAVRAWSKLEVEAPGDDGPLLQLVDREISLQLPDRLLVAVRDLAAMTGVPRDELLKRVVETALDVARLRTPVYSPVPLVKDVSYDVVAAVETQPEQFRGFEVAVRCERTRPSGVLAPHLVGYVSKASPRDVERAAEKYAEWPGRAYFMGLRAGRAGIEYVMDEPLRGEFGMQCVERDHMGREQQVLADAPATAGRDVVLTIDSRLQKVVEEALGDTPGAAIFLDVQTGHVLAIASAPRFDPDRIATQYAQYADDPGRPLFNRAVAGSYPLGSVFKIVPGLAALEKGCAPNSVYCSGAVRLGNATFHCHNRAGHGSLGVTDAFKHSCNVFFFESAQRCGAEAVIDVARRLGFGAPTGIGIPGERAGNVPLAAPGGQLLNLAIGQGELVVTPLQVAQMVAAVANDGVLAPPRVVRELRPFASEGPAAEAVADGRKPVNLGLSRRSIDAVHVGLYKGVNEVGGTGYRPFQRFSRPFRVCGKTSTAQRGGNQPCAGWFAGFAPHEKPRVAFAIVVENLAPGQSGGAAVGPIARRVFDEIPLDLLGISAAASEGAR